MIKKSILDFRSMLFQNFRLSGEKEDFKYCTEIIISKEEMMKILRKCYRCDVFSQTADTLFYYEFSIFFNIITSFWVLHSYVLLQLSFYTFHSLYCSVVYEIAVHPPAAIPLIVRVLLILMSSIRKSFQITKICHPRLPFQDFRLS